MKTYKEMAADALDRISRYEAEKQNRIKRVNRIAVPAVSCCLAAAVCFGVWRTEGLSKRTKFPDADITAGENTASDINTDEKVNEAVKKDVGETTSEAGENGAMNQENEQLQKEFEHSENAAPQTDNSPIVSDDEDLKGSESSSMGFPLFWWNNKLVMQGDLYWALNDDPDGTFAVTAKYRPTPEKVSGFTYEGKTLFRLSQDADNERRMPEKMTELLKVGDELKYGTALYETGTPDGIKWDRALYEDQLAYFGNLLDKYIADGRFLSDQLKKDIEDYNETSAMRTYKLAYNEYLITVLNESEKLLSDSGIKCERTPHSSDSLNIVVTAAELENLPLEHAEFWIFGLTNNNLKSSQPAADAENLTVVN